MLPSSGLSSVESEPVSTMLNLPAELRFQILLEVLEPDKPLELSWKPESPEDGAKTTLDPRFNVLLTCKQIRDEGTKLLKDNVPFMLNLGYPSVSEALVQGVPNDTTENHATTKLWKSLQDYRTVVLKFGVLCPNGTPAWDDAHYLRLSVENMQSVLRVLCGRGIEYRPAKRIIIEFDLTQTSERRSYTRFLAMMDFWMQSSKMISIRCHSDVSSVFFQEDSQRWDWSQLRARRGDRIEMVEYHGTDESRAATRARLAAREALRRFGGEPAWL